MTVPISNDPFSFFADVVSGIWQLNGFNPSSVSVREQRIREQADRTIRQLVERFAEKDFFPDEGVELVFAMLTQLTDWPANLQLRIVNEQGDVLASYLKGSDANLVHGYVSLGQRVDGDYFDPAGDALGGNDQEPLFRFILSQLPAGSTLGTGGNFPGSATTAGRIVTLREQMADLAKSRHAQLFDALVADVSRMKSDTPVSVPNPFLPFWRSPPAHYTPIVNSLLSLAPEMPVGRIHALLEQSPLSEAQQREFIEDGTLPESFAEALSMTIDEWDRDRGIDGVLHTRTYNLQSDMLAREFVQSLLKTHFDRALSVIEAVDGKQQPEGLDDTHILLRHNGDGEYSLHDLLNGGIAEFGTGTDSFYRAIASTLQPHELLRLGMQWDVDVAGLRATIGEAVVSANGGWFDPEQHLVVENQNLPDWVKNAPTADKLIWSDAWQDYEEALVDAQAPGLPDVDQYGDPEQIRDYASSQLKQRLRVDLGLSLDPDQVFVETTENEWIGGIEAPPVGNRPGTGEFEYTTTRRGLIQLCLENIGIEDLGYWLTARIIDRNGHQIEGLSRGYVHGLVRDLNIGESYTRFLEQRLLSSEQGQWSRDRYAQVMCAQMSLDAIEARMAGDFLSSSNVPPDQANRGYKWVKAVLDHPVDDGGRPLVEGHSIQVQQLRIHGRSLDGVLIIGPASRQSVPGVVLYTPHEKDGIRFHELSSFDEVESRLSGNPQYLAALEILGNVSPDYVVIPGLPDQPGVGHSSVDLVFDTQPITANFYHVSYQYEVRRVLAGVDAQTTSTWEANLKSAWNMASKLVDIVIEFVPFKVRLPIAAVRSLYALLQGVREVGSGGNSALVHFLQAGLLLADGLPGMKKPKTKLRSIPNLDPKKALRKAPEGLTLRTDGVYNGVYEKVNNVGPSSFYGKDAGKTFSIRYDTEHGTWRMIDPLRPDAYYQMPIRFNTNGRWAHGPLIRGGKGQTGAKGNRKHDRSTEPSITEGSSPKKLFTLDMDGFFEGREFKKAQKNIQEDLEDAINKAVARYTTEGKGHLHPSEAGLFSLDLPGIGGSRGRGAWRLMFERPKDGILKCHSVRDPH